MSPMAHDAEGGGSGGVEPGQDGLRCAKALVEGMDSSASVGMTKGARGGPRRRTMRGEGAVLTRCVPGGDGNGQVTDRASVLPGTANGPATERPAAGWHRRASPTAEDGLRGAKAFVEGMDSSASVGMTDGGALARGGAGDEGC